MRGRLPIQDEFTHLKVSKQRKKQLRYAKAGLCTLCGAQAVISGYCLKHAVLQREMKRKQVGSKRRYKSKTYRLERSSNV